MSSPAALRVASLLPAATEIVAALGAAELLVGVSHECDWPASVRGRRVLTRPRVDARGTSREIHDAIAGRALSALAVYDVELAALADARPDVILTQDLCDVCAVDFASVRRAVAELGLEAARIVSLKPLDLKGIWRSIGAVAEALGLPERGERLVADLQARMGRVAARAARLAKRPRVLTIEWLDPVMVGGTWMPELVRLARGEALVAQPGEHAPVLDARALARLDPEVVVLKPCGFTLARSLADFATLERLLTSVDWAACRSGDLFLCDGNAFFNRPGPRIAESLEILAACLHPYDFKDLGARHAASYQRLGVRRGRARSA